MALNDRQVVRSRRLELGICVITLLLGCDVTRGWSTPTRVSSRAQSGVVRSSSIFRRTYGLHPPRSVRQADAAIENTSVMQLKSAASSKETEESTSQSLEKKQEGQDPSNREMSIWAARGLLLLVAAIWGTNFASVKYLESLCFHPPCNHPPSEAAFARFGLAAIISLPLLFRQRWDVIRAGFECGMFISMGYITQALALAYIPSGECAFICSLTVVFVPLAAAAMYGKPIKPMNLVAAAAALAGVGVLEGMINVDTIVSLLSGIPEAASATSNIDTLTLAASASSSVGSVTGSVVSTALSSSSVETASAAFGPLDSLANILGVDKGDIMALGQPVGFGSAFLRIEHYQEKFKDVPDRVLTIAAAQCVSVGLIALLWVLYDYHGVIPDFGYIVEPHRLVAIAWTGVITTVVAIFLEGIALQTASATDAAITFSSEPVWASLFGFLLLHEQLGMNSYVGGGIIMLACLIGALSDVGSDTAAE